MLESLRDLPIVGDVRGAGYFHAIELVKDQETKETFNDEESRDAAARLPVGRALPPRADLPRRRPRRPGDPAVAAADRRARAVRRDRGDPASGADRGRRADAGRMPAAATRTFGRGWRAPDADRRELLRELDVRLLAGESGLDLPVRWVHISELLDPTPWLSGGELLLTTGTAARHARSASASSSRAWPITSSPGLGFGTGFDARRASRARCWRLAARARLPGVRGPLRGPVHRDHRGGVHAARQRAVRGPATRARRAGAARADRALRARARGAGRRARVADRRRGAGVRRARRAARAARVPARDSSPRRCRCCRARSASGRAAATRARSCRRPRRRQPRAGASGRRRRRAGPAAPVLAASPEAWLVAIKDSGPLSDFDRLTLHQAVTIVALELLRSRVAGDTERRLAGDLLAADRRGELTGSELTRRLAPFGLSDQVAAIVVAASRTTGAGRRRRPRTALVAGAARRGGAGAGRHVGLAHVRAGAGAGRGGAVRARRAGRRPDRRRARSTRSSGRHRAARSPAARRGGASTRRAARSRRSALGAIGARRRTANGAARGSAERPSGWRPTGTSARSSCCCRCRTTRRCGCSATRSSGRSRPARVTTAAS